ncbi:leucine rich adaptor protein 1-like [Megalobrama amblycephala]|uniref:leucine rich adaptor protein 1-like n=1 Tax=Megalobrama amblycephala TaxID=75352 RepID=UPI002013E5BB|nr:leucine rich adaptor protein 1-like [Megalobrama amblycephala]
MMKMEELPDFRDVENKLGRKVPESLIRSFTGEAAIRCSESHARADDLNTLNNKIRFLRQQMAHLRSIDVKLMHQLLSINEGIESIRWVMEERGGVASREGSLTGSLYSLSDSQDASQQGSCSDGLDGISVGSYLDTLGEDDPENDSPSDLTDGFSNKPVVEEETFKKPPHRPRVETDEYYCFG